MKTFTLGYFLTILAILLGVFYFLLDRAINTETILVAAGIAAFSTLIAARMASKDDQIPRGPKRNPR